MQIWAMAFGIGRTGKGKHLYISMQIRIENILFKIYSICHKAMAKHSKISKNSEAVFLNLFIHHNLIIKKTRKTGIFYVSVIILIVFNCIFLSYNKFEEVNKTCSYRKIITN